MSGAVVLGLSCPHLWSLYSLAQLAANVLTPKSVYCTYINPHPNSVQHEFSVCHVIPKVVAAVTTNSVLLLPRFSLLFCLSKKLAVAPRTANCQSFGGGQYRVRRCSESALSFQSQPRIQPKLCSSAVSAVGPCILRHLSHRRFQKWSNFFSSRCLG